MRESRLIDDIVRADQEFMSVLGTVYKALQTGELKHEDVYAYSRAENIGNFERLVALFDAGNLFRAQKMDFDSWLKAVDYGKATDAAEKATAFAKSLAPLLQGDDTVWAHDYHLIPFARLLRREGFTGRLDLRLGHSQQDQPKHLLLRERQRLALALALPMG